MLRKHGLLLGIIASLAISAAAYFWVMAMMDSLYAFRSPLHATPPQPGEPLGSRLAERVVVVLVDGLRADTSLRPEVMPFLAELRSMGAAATMRSRPPTFSAPSYTVLFTGAWPDLSDGPPLNLEYEEYSAWSQDNLFSAASRAGLAGAVSAYNWFEKLIPEEARADGFFTAGEDTQADRDVVDAALPWLRDRRHALTLIHLDQVDYAGHHEGGARSAAWDAAARRTDDLLREVAGELDFTRDTLVVLSDHGHIDAGGHGGQDPITRIEPFVIVGAGVRPGQYADIDQVDVAPTLAALLGTAIPASSQGRAVREMLALPPEELANLERAEVAQQALLAGAYGAAIGRPVVTAEGADAGATQRAMDAARDARLMSERWPRIVVAVTYVLALVFALWRYRSPRRLRMLLASLVYLLVFNLRYAVLDGGTYSLSSVTGVTDLIIYMAINTTIALVAGWLVLVATTGLLRTAPGEAARVSVAWSLLTTAIAAVPLVASFAWNGPLTGWALPEFNLFFLAFLALLQAVFLGVAGLALSGIAALIARLREGSRPISGAQA